MIATGIPQPAPFDPDSLQGDYLYKPGLSGGQQAFGGTDPGDVLELQGADAAPDTGIVRIASPLSLTYDTFSNTTPAEQFAVRWNPTFTADAAYVGGCLSVAPTVTIETGIFIPATFSDQSNMLCAIDPGFSAHTFINELATIRNDGNFNLIQSLVINVGMVHERNTAGTSTTTAMVGLSFQPQSRTTTALAVLTRTSQTAVQFRPSFSTVASSQVNLGTLRGLHCQNPGGAIFQPTAGVEAMTAYYGLDCDNISFGGAAERAVIRSNMSAGTNKWFLLHDSTAESDFGSGHVHLNDNTFLKFGNDIADADILFFWGSVEGKFTYSTAFGIGSNPMYLHATASDEWLWSQNSGGALDIGIGFDVNAIVFGNAALPTPNSNNWFGLFGPPNGRQVQINGEYSDFLFSAGGAVDVDGNTVSDLQNFKFNVPSVLLNGGTVDDLSNIYVANMSSFGATRTQALRVQGRSRFDGNLNLGSLEPAQITANQNDYSLGINNNARAMNLLDSDAAYNITGIDSSFGFGQTGDMICLYNVGAFNLTFTNQDVLSVAANRIITSTGVGYIIGPNECVWLWYDDTGTARWRMLEGTGA